MEPTKIMETWLNLMTEAVRGNSDARETVRALTMSPVRPDEMLRMITRFSPMGGMISGGQAEMVNDWLEEYWKAMGVVPRYRYLELLERYERIRERLEELEANRTQFPATLEKTRSESTQRVINTWASLLEETMKTQQEMLRTMAQGPTERTADSGELEAAKPATPTGTTGTGTASGASKTKE